MNEEQLIRYERRVHDTGYHLGFHDGYKTVLPILTDLIAGLRDEHANGDGYCGAALEAADRAEQRLEEVQNA